MDSEQEKKNVEMTLEEKVEALRQWVVGRQPIFDEIIASAAESYIEQFGEDKDALNLAFTELYNAGDNINIDYSHQHIGFAYSLWYHARRFNMLLGILSEYLIEHRSYNDYRVELLDMGGGTGALPWAVNVLCKGIEELELREKPLSVYIRSIDQSEPMVTYARHLLNTFADAGMATPKVSHYFQVDSWEQAIEKTNHWTWIIVSYLFDSYDDPVYVAKTVHHFTNVLEKRPHRLILITSSKKSPIIVDITKEYRMNEGYSYDNWSNSPNNEIPHFPVFLQGRLERVNAVRQEVRRTINAQGGSKDAEWYTSEDHYAWVRVLTIWKNLLRRFT